MDCLLAGTVVHVVKHGLVAIHFQQILEFSVDDHGHVDGRIGTKMQHQLQLSAQFGVQHGTVKKSVGRVVKCKQREGPSLSPFLSRHHISLALAKTTGGFQETVITSHVQLIAIVIQLQGLVRVLLALHQLLDAGESKLLKGKRILFHVSVKGSGFHQSHHDQIGCPVLKRIVDLEDSFGGTQIVGPHFASHGGITHDALVHVVRQTQEEIGVEFDLAQQQFDLDVCHVETHRVRPSVSHGEEIGGVEEQLDANLYLGYQQFTQVKHFDHGFETQHVRLVHVLSVFLSHLFEGKSLRLGQGQMIRVRHVQLIGRQLTDGRVQSVDPSLRCQDGLSVVSVKIQYRVYQSLVSVRVRLRTDERVVESHANLLEERVGKIVGQKDAGGGSRGESGTVRFLEFQFQFEFALTQIDVFVFRIDLKIHRSDARGEWMDGYLASTGDAEIGRWDLEQIQHGIDDGFGTRDDGGFAHDDDVVSCNPMDGMNSSVSLQSLLTPSPSRMSSSRRCSPSPLTPSHQLRDQLHAGYLGGSHPQRTTSLFVYSARVDGCHANRKGRRSRVSLSCWHLERRNWLFVSHLSWHLVWLLS